MSTERDQQENAASLAHLESLGIHRPASAAVPRVSEPLTPRGPKVIDLKVQTKFWPDVFEFKVTAQLRQDDRQYRVGDTLLLREYDPSYGYTGKEVRRTVTHILRHEDIPYALRRGWCVLSTQQA